MASKFINFREPVARHNLTDDGGWQSAIIEFLNQWQSESATISVKTSGSTGDPKTLIFKKEQAIISAKNTIRALRVAPESAALLCLPVDFVAGKMMVVRAWQNGMKLYCSEPKTKVHVPSDGVDFAALTPLQVEKSFEDLRRIKTLIIGGSALSTSLNEKLKKLNINAFETYGMTETLTHCALRNVHKDYFQPLPSFSIQQGESGELVIKSPYQSAPLVTNDLVQILDENRFKFLGRLDFIINSGGIKIQPEPLEDFIQKLIGKEIILSGLKDQSLGEKLVGITSNLEVMKNRNEVLAFLKNRLPKNKCPKELIFLKNIPKTANQKINRIELKNIINERNTHQQSTGGHRAI